MRNGAKGNRDSHTAYALGCSVLRVGWLTSVALMQEANENMLKMGKLDAFSQIARGSPLPVLVTGLAHKAHEQGNAFWHV